MQKIDAQIQMFFQNPIHNFKVRKISKDLKRLEKIDQKQREILLNGNWDLYYKSPEQELVEWLEKPGNTKRAIKYFLFACASVFAVGYDFMNIRFVMIIGFILFIRSITKEKPPVS